MSQQMEPVDVGGVNVLRWNPPRAVKLRPQRFFRWTKKLPFAPRINNVGDIAGVDVVRYLHRELAGGHNSKVRTNLGAIGSIIHMLPAGTVVWGPGVNGKHLDLSLPKNLDIRAVRGPRTREYLMNLGYQVPEIFGDPGLLLPHITGDKKLSPTREITIIANLNDTRFINDERSLSALCSLDDFVTGIRRSEFIIASSLHGIIFADAYGIPVCPLVTEAEPLFKYLDYFEGTGRFDIKFAHSVEEALRIGPVPKITWDEKPLLQAFPSELWKN
ncbi:polysaccharide pyruvyl transferase family protein [Rothia sp. CCM 9418]|uniref:polysaccharide pyruvyl transferase family protein n=1 Tax=Rothia sp. CCM 9418 TaxID=3402661 RepID=UPI003AEC5F89